jgi:hypothetical protein
MTGRSLSGGGRQDGPARPEEREAGFSAQLYCDARRHRQGDSRRAGFPMTPDSSVFAGLPPRQRVLHAAR